MNSLNLYCAVKLKFYIVMIFRILCLLFIFSVQNSLFAQVENASVPLDWFLRDPQQDSVQGLSVEKTYSTLLKDQPAREIIVAVVDSGIDIDHEDLKDIIWTNPNEIPGNGLDDDKNGYIDDVHGWNFIGGKNGNVDADTYELTRRYISLNKKFEKVESGKVSKKQKAEYDQYIKIKEKYQKNPINVEDGLKIEFDNDWVHLRTSNTEPIMRIYAESDFESKANNIATRLMRDIKEFS